MARSRLTGSCSPRQSSDLRWRQPLLSPRGRFKSLRTRLRPSTMPSTRPVRQSLSRPAQATATARRRHRPEAPTGKAAARDTKAVPEAASRPPIRPTQAMRSMGMRKPVAGGAIRHPAARPTARRADHRRAARQPAYRRVPSPAEHRQVAVQALPLLVQEHNPRALKTDLCRTGGGRGNPVRRAPRGVAGVLPATPAATAMATAKVIATVSQMARARALRRRRDSSTASRSAAVPGVARSARTIPDRRPPRSAPGFSGRVRWRTSTGRKRP